MTLTVLRVGLDWLEHSLTGELTQERLDDLDCLKKKAQLLDTPQEYELGPAAFVVLPKAFGFWTYVLKHPEFEIRVQIPRIPGTCSS